MLARCVLHACSSLPLCAPLRYQAQIGGELYLDPTPAEVARAEATACVASLPAASAVTHLTLRGTWRGEGAAEAIETCIDGCAVLDQALRGALKASAAPHARAALTGRAAA